MGPRLLALLFIAIAVPVKAQDLPHVRMNCTLRVDVQYANGGRATSRLRVQLLKGLNKVTVGVSLTDNSGVAEFTVTEPDMYAVEVSGEGVDTVTSRSFVVEDLNAFQSVPIVVRKAGEDGENRATLPASAVATVDLNVPKKATQEYDRANEEMAHQNWKKAVEHFNKAVAIYPEFSSAYNNLAVSYSKLGQTQQERDALKKAIASNDHNVPALVNTARFAVADRNFAEAANLLNKAAVAEPMNVEVLALMVRVEFLQGRYEEAVAEARRIHEMPHQKYAMVHYTAASALERQNRFSDAAVELKLFLQEEPEGPQAEKARKALAAFLNEPR